jgi:hypothetical protein
MGHMVLMQCDSFFQVCFVTDLTEAHLNASYGIFFSIYEEYLCSIPLSDCISEPIKFKFSQ